jgi:hypothetical protein
VCERDREASTVMTPWLTGGLLQLWKQKMFVIGLDKMKVAFSSPAMTTLTVHTNNDVYTLAMFFKINIKILMSLS